MTNVVIGAASGMGAATARRIAPRGSLIVAEFDSLQEAQEWADGDPYVEAGVFARVTVKPFKKVFPG